MRKKIYTALILFGILVNTLAFTSHLRAEAPPVSESNTSSLQPVYVLTMKGAVGPAYSDYLKQGITAAKGANAQLIILKLNTPGGLLTSTRDMVSDILSSPIPIAVWVTPSGAHAASAGTFLLYASHIAAMDHSTNIGAATPIKLGSGSSSKPKKETKSDNKDNEAQKEEKEPQKNNFPSFFPSGNNASEAKAMEDTLAFMRSIAENNARNIDWAQKAITEASSITAKEALEKGVIEYIAGSLPDLLTQIDGKEISIKNKAPITLKTKSAKVIDYTPDLRTKFLSLITDPNVAFLLMSIGTYGLILEFYNPGTFIPGTIGAICLLIGLFALNILPVNAAGIALISLGLLLMMGEALVPAFGILGLGGLVAFIFGATILFDTGHMPGLYLDMSVILSVAFTGLLFLSILLTIAIRFARRKTKTGAEGLIGAEGEVLNWQGRKGHVRVFGEDWAAKSQKTYTLQKGNKIIIKSLNHLTLTIKPFNNESTS